MKDEESDESKVHAKESADSIIKQEVNLDLSDGSSSSGPSEQADEETLEDIADDPAVRESQNFSESEFAGSGGGKMPSAALQSESPAQEPVQNFSEPPKSERGLEQSASSSIGDNTIRPRESNQEVYKPREEAEAGYAQLYEQKRLQELRVESSQLDRQHSVIAQQKVNIQDFDQRKMGDNSPSAPSTDYQLLEIEGEEDAGRRMPFQRSARDDYKILRKWKK